MAQQPEKLRWKERVPYGLSASQFGAALGFSVGRVSDYVDYLRHVVGTSHEFRGNECTEHGIATESKSRCLYEMLTGIEVMDGGFFLSPEGLLGCSPDGLSYYYTKDDDDDDEQKKKSEWRMCGPSTNNATCTPQKVDVHHNEEASCTPPTKQLCSFRIPFTRRKATHVDVPTPSPQSSPTTNNNNNNNSNNTHVVSATTFSTPPPTISSSSSSTTRASRPRLRCLEIKSPFRALYGANKTNHQPFGIPLVYMCQMQGQMAIAEADECDFFVFLNGPPTQVEAWRVRRSPHFWEWAYPKLLQVVQWVHEGPPTWLNRSFHFDHFDFSTICVEPLVFPYDISANMPLEDVRHYSFFCREPSPYAEDVGEVVAAWPTMSSRQRIAAMVRHPLVQQLFIPSEEASNDEDVEHHHHRHCYEVDRSVSTILASQAACSSTHPWSGVPCAAVESGYIDAISVMSWDDGTLAMRWMMMNHSPQHHHIMNCNSQLLRCELRFFHRDLFSTLTPTSVVPAPSTAPTTTTRRRSTGPWELESATCLSQQIRLSLTPQRRKVEAEEVAERAPSSTPPWMEPSTAHLVAPLQLTMGDLMELIDDAVDCREVIWVGAHDTPLRRWRTNRAATDALEEDLLYSLVVGPSEVVVELLCRPPASWALRWHATVEDLAASLVQSVQQHHVQDRAHAFVLCELREGNDSRPLDPLPIPRFVLFGADPPILRESIAARLQQHQECFS